MAAYGVFIREQTTDAAELEAYSPRAAASLAGHTVKVLAAYGRQEIWEGAEVEGVVIVKFPTMEAAQTWYESPAYREAREYRFRGAKYRAILVEGL